MRSFQGRRCLLATGFTIVFTALALTQGLPKLPADVALPQGKDSPGKVVFSHATHVDQAKPDCTTCHPKLFKLVNPQVVNGTEHLLHAKMEKGAQCGSCHNGKGARGFDDCTMCHRPQ
jgi:c(7)-type cytochrome triheme protein